MTELQESVRVGCPLGVVAEILAHRPGDWLRPFLRIASHEGDAVGTKLRATLGRAPGGPLAMRKAVLVTLGEPEISEESVVVPVRWEAAGYRALFPVFEGRFLLRPAGDGETEVALSGRYDPPGSVVGDVVDRLVARRAAEVSVRNLLENLRVAVEELVRAPNGSRSQDRGPAPSPPS
ncbi:MAG: SRPBCC family protein [Acidobacteria bacterium]|nr:SRPBCC family protein [Acidobacteriota bacterium]